LLRLALAIVASYLAATLLPLIAWAAETHSYLPLAVHTGVLALVTLACCDRLPRALRDWTPLAVGPFLYFELRWLIAAVGHVHADARVLAWEEMFFPSAPSQTLAVRWPWGALSEVLHAAYLSYYLLIYVPPAVLWLRNRRFEFEATILALSEVYALCFLCYVLMPVDGPRFHHGPSAAPEGPVRSAVMALLASASSRGTAFPSSHVAASIVAAGCALRFQPRMGIVTSVLCVGLAFGAVYGGYHYAVVVVAGVATGALSLALGRLVEVHIRNASEREAVSRA
jgi:membrane-associated phospholipid phosphatase